MGWRSDETGAPLKETERNSSHRGGGTASEKFSEVAGIRAGHREGKSGKSWLGLGQCSHSQPGLGEDGRHLAFA